MCSAAISELLAPIPDADWPEAVGEMRAGFAGGLNVYRTMAHHPALLRAWAGLRDHIVNRTALGPVRAEVVVLRCGHRMNAPYEWDSHILRARRVGLSDARIAALGGPLDRIGAEDRPLAEAVDLLLDHARLPEPVAQALVAQVGVEGLLDLMATVGFYSTLGFILNTAATPLDDDIAKALAAAPFDPPRG